MELEIGGITAIQNYVSAPSFTPGFHHLFCWDLRRARLTKTGFHHHPPVAEALTRRGRVGRGRGRSGIHSSELGAAGDSPAVLEDESPWGPQLWRHQGPCCCPGAVVAVLLPRWCGQVSLYCERPRLTLRSQSHTPSS